MSHWAPSWCPEELLAQRQTDNVHWCDSPCIMPSSVSWTATVIRPLYHRFWFTGISRGWFIRRTRQGLGVRRIYTVYAARTIHELFHIWLLVSTFVPRYSKIRPRKNKEQNSGKITLKNEEAQIELGKRNCSKMRQRKIKKASRQDCSNSLLVCS